MVIEVPVKLQTYMRHHREDAELWKELHTRMKSLEQNVLKKDRQSALDIAMAEGEITQYLPFDGFGPGMDFMFTNNTTSRCISNYIWSVLENSNMPDPNLTDLTVTALRLCFSGRMRAHMYYSKQVKT